jgi:hypothetical protein
VKNARKAMTEKYDNDMHDHFSAHITGVFNDRVELVGYRGAVAEGEKIVVSRAKDFAGDFLSKGCGKGAYVEGVVKQQQGKRVFKHITFIA